MQKFDRSVSRFSIIALKVYSFIFLLFCVFLAISFGANASYINYESYYETYEYFTVYG